MWMFVGSGGTAVAAPTVASVSPNVADTAGGGGIVTITGTNFVSSPVTVTLGGVSATSVTVVNATTITCVPGARSAGASLSVLVTTPGGTNGANTLFEYWTPSQITGISAYLDANKGVTGGASVTTWLDQSANARSFASATATKAAQTASVFGTLPSLRFAATAVLQLASPVSITSGLSTFAVAKWTATTATQTFNNAPLTIVGDTSGSYCAFGASAGAIASNHYGAPNVQITRGSGLNDGNPRLIGATMDTTVNAKCYVGVTQQGTTNTDATGINAASVYNALGGGYGPGDGFAGDLGAIIIVSGVIGSTDLTKLNSWSQQRFGTP